MTVCPKCGSAQVWVDLHDLPFNLVEAHEKREKYVKIDLTNREVICAKCGHKFIVFKGVTNNGSVER